MGKAAEATGRNEAGRSFDADLLLIGALALLTLLSLSLAPALFNDGDTSWHLAAGRWILTEGRVPRADPFSFTYLGHPWTAHEWLSELLMAGVFAIGSWNALSLLFASAVAAALLVVGLEARRWLRGLPLAALLLSVLVMLSPFAVARPHVLAWPLLAGWTLLLLRAREGERPPPMAAALLMLVWANMHGSFLLGLALIGPFALEALLEAGDRRAALRGWGMFGLASLAAAVATPHGLHGLLFPLQLGAMKSLPLVMEWRPSIVADMPGFQMVLLAVLFCALHRRVRIPVVRLLLLIALLYLAFAHVRHQAVLAIVGALLLARCFSSAPAAARRAALPAAAPIVLAGLMLAVWMARPLFPASRAENASNPMRAIAGLPKALRGAPVLNSYGFGGPLILAGVRPFIDGRADMYGDAFVMAHQRMMAGDLPAFRRTARRWRIRWTILSPQDPLALLLDAQPEWRRIYADRWAVVHVAR